MAGYYDENGIYRASPSDLLPSGLPRAVATGYGNFRAPGFFQTGTGTPRPAAVGPTGEVQQDPGAALRGVFSQRADDYGSRDPADGPGGIQQNTRETRDPIDLAVSAIKGASMLSGPIGLVSGIYDAARRPSDQAYTLADLVPSWGRGALDGVTARERADFDPVTGMARGAGPAPAVESSPLDSGITQFDPATGVSRSSGAAPAVESGPLADLPGTTVDAQSGNPDVGFGASGPVATDGLGAATGGIYRRGGFVPRTGSYRLHQGEVVARPEVAATPLGKAVLAANRMGPGGSTNRPERPPAKKPPKKGHALAGIKAQMKGG